MASIKNCLAFILMLNNIYSDDSKYVTFSLKQRFKVSVHFKKILYC